MPAVEVPVRVCPKKSFVPARDYLCESRGSVGFAGAPDLDDGVVGEGEVVVEEMFLPDDGGEEMRVYFGNGVVYERLEMGAEFGDGHVVCVCVYFVAAEMEEGGVV